MSDVDGGLIEGSGLANEGTWQLGTACNGSSIAADASCAQQEQFFLDYSVNGSQGGGGGAVYFESSPTRMVLQTSLLAGDWSAWYVPLQR